METIFNVIGSKTYKNPGLPQCFRAERRYSADPEQRRTRAAHRFRFQRG